MAHLVLLAIMLRPSSSQPDFCILGRLGYNHAINGFYEYQGMWHNYSYYKRDTEEGSGYTDFLYVFWSYSSAQLLIHSSLDDGGDCCYARCTLFGAAHDPNECNNAWEIWDGTEFVLDPNVFSIPDSCPSFCIWGRLDYNRVINGLYKYQGIWNNHPYYKRDNGGEFCTILYIFWSQSYTRLLIHSSLDDGGSCCYARCTLFDTAHVPIECDNGWEVWDGTEMTLDSNVYSVIDECPSWQCDEVSVTSICKGGACDGCEGPFDEHIAPNVWKNNPNRYWYFAPFDFRWVCGEYPPDCKNTYIETATAQGWTYLYGGSIDLDFTLAGELLADPKSYKVNCINYPTQNPTSEPTPAPTIKPTSSPTNIPTSVPSNIPTSAPTNNPTTSPTNNPTTLPTNNPTTSRTNNPTTLPTNNQISSTNNPIISTEINSTTDSTKAQTTIESITTLPTNRKSLHCQQTEITLDSNKRKAPSKYIFDSLDILYLLLSISVVFIFIVCGFYAFKKRKSKMAENEIIAEVVHAQHIVHGNPVQDWIANTLGLAQYVEIFIENGYDEMSLVMIMNERDLKEIGIDNKEHRKKIVAEIEKLREMPGANGEVEDMGMDTVHGTIEGEIGTYSNNKQAIHDINVNNISFPTKKEVETNANIQDGEFVISGDGD